MMPPSLPSGTPTQSDDLGAGRAAVAPAVPMPPPTVVSSPNAPTAGQTLAGSVGVSTDVTRHQVWPRMATSSLAVNSDTKFVTTHLVFSSFGI
jgi:hypothetical protein